MIAENLYLTPIIYQPRARIFRYSFLGPLLHGHPKRIVQRVLGQIKIPEQPNQRRQDSSGFGFIQPVQGIVKIFHWNGFWIKKPIMTTEKGDGGVYTDKLLRPLVLQALNRRLPFLK